MFLSWNYKAGRFLSQHERNEQLKKLIIELAETLFIHKYADSKEEHDFRQKPDSPTRKDGLIYNGQLNTFVDEKVLNADSQKFHDYLWQYVAQQIDELFASIDNVGYLFVEENWCRTPRIGRLHHHNKRDKNKETVVDKVMNSSSNYQLQF